jgi:hypothetical protein
VYAFQGDGLGRVGSRDQERPQAFSHVALINTALNLSEHRTPADQRSGRAQQASELAAT